MQKKILLLVWMILSGIFFTSVEENGLKACSNQAAAGLPVQCAIEPLFVEDADASFNMFMNPFDHR